MRRRKFLALLGGAAAAWPCIARSQSHPIPVIGYLYAGSPEAAARYVERFRGGLAEHGWFTGTNVVIEFRWAKDKYENLPELAADLVRRQVSVMVAPGGAITALAAKKATSAIPIVFSLGGDPVQIGLVASLARPGGNATGVNFFNIALGGKRLGLLHELLPKATRIALLINPNNPLAQSVETDVKSAAAMLGKQIVVRHATDRDTIDAAFGVFAEKRADALVVSADTVFNNRHQQIVALAERLQVPAIYPNRDFAVAGGLMAYGTNVPEVYRHLGNYAGRILKGAKPADLPVTQPTKFELVINQRTAAALGLALPLTLIGQADEVIE